MYVLRMLILFATLVCSTVNAQAVHHPHDTHQHHAPAVPSVAKEPGQSAFAALSEAVAVLETDPTTDWSKVNVERLRDHLLDMDEVVMRSEAKLSSIDNSISIDVRGAGRTLEAIRRMVPAHAGMMNGYRGWRSSTQLHDNGVIWTLMTPSPAERERIRALGFYGLLTLGSHHAPHHLAIAKGEMLPSH